jgi:hypothetical protein
MTTIRTLVLTLATAALPGLAGAATLPMAGDMLGTTPEALTAALAEAGCAVDEIGAEDGLIEAKCHTAEGVKMEIYIDPASGTVAEVKEDE